ncbi:MAG TPA: ATP-binding cassette domain-containing protein [Termitinemataceae bacterium]|nr:ATP-binding cassette domain-containing protein [Termitinemataceae bacterium]HOM22240.1 ATP-binding cassette domain-containing protein [Termitinemataceae bacterium]HPP99338.1 ATP-binding cassette domain-containing protein [Termitinemataceae bacterium]
MNTIIEAQRISVTLAQFPVLTDVSLSLPEGMSTIIIGKAGSGKSTLLKTLAGLVVPDQGKVLYRGIDIGKASLTEERHFRSESAFVFQDAALWANQSIYNNLMIPLSIHFPSLSKNEIDSRIREIVQRVGYNESLAYRPADLSMGEQKLISLARALIYEPSVLFLDEPTSSLDMESSQHITNILLEEKKKGTTIVAVSHDNRLISRLADYVCVVFNGGIADFNTLENIAPRLGKDIQRLLRSKGQEQASLDETSRDIYS